MAPLEEAEPQLPRRRPSNLDAAVAWSDELSSEQIQNQELDALRRRRVGEILERLREQVFKRRVRVKDAFKDFDKLQCGRCTEHQFKRALKYLLPGLDTDDADILVQHFKCQPGRRIQWPQVYNYLAFCNHVEEVFGPKHLENRPSKQVWEPGSRLASKVGAARPRMAEEEEERYWDLLHRVGVLTQTRGIDLHAIFETNTRPKNAVIQLPRGCGKITEQMFRHKFPFVAHFSEDDLNILIKRYRLEFPESIHVAEFLKDIEELLEEKQRRERLGDRPGERARSLSNSGARLELPPQEERMHRQPSKQSEISDYFDRKLSKASSAAEIIYQRPQSAASRADEFAQEQEPSSRGMSRNASDAVLQERPVPQSAQRPGSAVASKRTAERQAEKHGMLPGMASRPRSAYSNARSGTRPGSAVPQVDIMTKIRQMATERRLHFAGLFSDFDKLRKGVCTEGSFKTALTIMRIDLSAEERDRLFELYRGEGGTFRYPAFCADIGEKKETSSAACSLRYKATLDAEEQEQLDKVKAMLQRRVQLRRMEITTCFHDFCKRSGTSTAGHVTASLVGRIMTVLGFHLSEDEVEILCKAYCDTADGQGFNYLSFCADVDPPVQEEPFMMRKSSAAPPQPRGHGRYFDDHGRITPSKVSRPGSASCNGPRQIRA